MAAGAAPRCATGTTRWDCRAAGRWGRPLNRDEALIFRRPKVAALDLVYGAHLVLTGSGPERASRQLETSVRGVFAIGDVRSGSIKRVAAAVGEGAQVVAALHALLAEDADRPANILAKGSA